MPKGIYKRIAGRKRKKMAESTKIKIGLAHRLSLSCKLVKMDSKNPKWKGDKVGYNALHSWISRKLGKALKCQFCGKKKTTPHSVQWANINHSYKRNFTDWIPLCVPCHRKYDIINNKKN